MGGLNPSYNCFTVAGPMGRRLKESGLSVDDITRLALDEIFAMAARYDAVAAWLTVPVRPLEQSYAAYFGFVSELGNRRSIPMTLAARDQHICLADWTMDERISPRLTNRKNDVLA